MQQQHFLHNRLSAYCHYRCHHDSIPKTLQWQLINKQQIGCQASQAQCCVAGTVLCDILRKHSTSKLFKKNPQHVPSKKLGTTHPIWQWHIPEGQNPQSHHCDIHKTHNKHSHHMISYICTINWTLLQCKPWLMIHKRHGSKQLLPIYSINPILIKQLDALISQIYFWNKTLHVSDSFSL